MVHQTMADDIINLTAEQIVVSRTTAKMIVQALPQKTIDLLALGPINDDEGIRGCRLCDTMDETIDRNDSDQMALANILLDYHDIDGSVGPECYRRCLQIYIAAGWKP